MTTSSAAFDADGVLHVVYGTEGLYYLAFEDGDWTVETVAGVTRPDSPAMTIDEQGDIHAIFSRTNDSPAYARRTDSGWDVQTIPGLAAGDGQPYNLAVRDGVAHFIFTQSDGMLAYARLDDTGWLVEPIAPHTDDTSQPAPVGLALDTAGNPTVCYGSETHLKVARRAGLTWEAESVHLPADSFLGCDLVFAPDDTLHVVYGQSGVGLLYSIRGPQGWATEIAVRPDEPEAGESDYEHSYPSLRLDSAGTPHVAFVSVAYGYSWYAVQHYATRGPDGWTVDLVEIDEYPQNGTLALDGDTAAVVFLRASGPTLAVLDGDEWESTLLDPSGAVGYGSSLVLRGFEMHVSYLDLAADSVYYARRTRAGWSYERVDSAYSDTFPVVMTTRLALDPGGAPHIVYDDTFRFNGLDYARWDGSKWQISMLPNFPVNEPFALSVDSQGEAHFAYAVENLLRYTRSTMLPDSEIVDSHVFSGGIMDLETDREGNVHMAYASLPGVRYAVRPANGPWVIETLPSTTGAGHVSLALDDEGRPHLAFTMGDSGGVIYAARPAPETPWRFETVAGDAGSGSFPSIAIDHLDRVHLSFYDSQAEDLIYARRSGTDGAWEWMRVVSDGSVGSHSSLALDPFGNPVITYRDDDTWDAMVVAFPPGELTEASLPVVVSSRTTVGR